jgi:DNA polymerase-3 subunit epsilon
MTPNWKQSRWFVVDTETTGTQAGTDRIVELAAVVFERGAVVWKHSTLVNPGIPIPAEASSIHGITDAMVADAPSIGDIAPAFLEAMKDVEVLVAYNAPFDVAFLRAELGPGWDDVVQHTLVVDPLDIVRMPEVGKFWKGKGRHRLGSVAQRYGITIEGDLHRAAADAVLAGHVLWHLFDILPDDGVSAARTLSEARAQAEADYQRYVARQRAAGAEGGLP